MQSLKTFARSDEPENSYDIQKLLLMNTISGLKRQIDVNNASNETYFSCSDRKLVLEVVDLRILLIAKDVSFLMFESIEI